MSTIPGTPVTVENYLQQPLVIGEPDVTGPMAVFPVFGAPPSLSYISMARAHGQGFTVKELPGGASVRDLIVSNPGPEPVLLFEGEEVLGAQQNRTFDSSILVPAGAEQRVPVSCVEAGRWDGSRHSEEFRPAGHSSHPDLRREKASQAARAREAGMDARADQGKVWDHVAAKSMSMGVDSATGSMNDVYENRRNELEDLAGGINLHDGQIGMLVQIGDEVFALDLVSRPDVMADLHRPLVTGYSLDAISIANGTGAEADPARAKAFLDRTTETRILERDGVGLGRDFRFEDAALVGSGLVAGEELIQISAFPADRNEDPRRNSAADPVAARQARIVRASRRRR